MVSVIIFVIFMVTMGYVLGVKKVLSRTAANDLNRLAFYFTLPALIFNSLHGADLAWDVAILPIAAWLVVSVGVVIGFILVSLLRLAPPQRGALIIAIAFGNTTFLGYPIIQGFYGDQPLALAIMYDLFGSTLAANTIGVFVAMLVGFGGEAQQLDGEAPSGAAEDQQREPFFSANSLGIVGRRLVSFPPLWALLLALAMRGLAIPPVVMAILERVGQITVPIIMLSIGLSFQFHRWSENLPLVLLIALCRLMVIPLLAWLSVGFLDLPLPFRQVIVLQAGMPSMFFSFVLASLFGLNRSLVLNAILFSTALSFLTLPMWHMIMSI